jgi:hypothetical protein
MLKYILVVVFGRSSSFCGLPVYQREKKNKSELTYWKLCCDRRRHKKPDRLLMVMTRNALNTLIVLWRPSFPSSPLHNKKLPALWCHTGEQQYLLCIYECPHYFLPENESACVRSPTVLVTSVWSKLAFFPIFTELNVQE